MPHRGAVRTPRGKLYKDIARAFSNTPLPNCFRAIFLLPFPAVKNIQILLLCQGLFEDTKSVISKPRETDRINTGFIMQHISHTFLG